MTTSRVAPATMSLSIGTGVIGPGLPRDPDEAGDETARDEGDGQRAESDREGRPAPQLRGQRRERGGAGDRDRGDDREDEDLAGRHERPEVTGSPAGLHDRARDEQLQGQLLAQEAEGNRDAG